MDVLFDGSMFLSEEELGGCRVQGVRLDEGTVLCDRCFTDVRFVDCDFSSCHFSDCLFIDCIFERCDLSLCRFLGSEFKCVTFIDSRLLGMDWSEMKWPLVSAKRRPMCRMSFYRCSLNSSVFVGLSLRGIVFEGCSVKEACFEGCYLYGSSFVDSDLSESVFVDNNLCLSDFRGSCDYFIEASRNELKGARFSLPEATSLLLALGVELE